MLSLLPRLPTAKFVARVTYCQKVCFPGYLLLSLLPGLPVVRVAWQHEGGW